MVNYALRMSQSAVQRLTQADSLGDLKESHPVFFGFVGKQQGSLWVGNEYYDMNENRELNSAILELCLGSPSYFTL